MLLTGGEAYGAPFLVERLGRDGRLAWMRAAPRDRGDPVAQGNLLAEALNGAVGGPLFPSALPFAYHLRALRHYRSDLAPLTLALSEAQHAPELARALVDLDGAGVRVLLDAPDGPPGVRAAVVPPETLALTPDEARELAPTALDDDEVARLWRASAGRMVDFLSRALAAVDMPLPSLPSPDARLLPPGEARGEEPRRVVRALARERRWVEALDLAVMASPEAVEELLVDAGPAYQERGLLQRLHLLLSALDDPYRRAETVLEWRLVAGFGAGDPDEAVADADAHLATFAAARLRARRAGMLEPEAGLAMAREALATDRDPLTLFQAGRLEPDGERAAELLLEAVRAAEEAGRPLAVVRNAGALGARYLRDGRLEEAVTWLQWALDAFARERLLDGDRRLRLLVDLASARVLLGEAAGLRGMLEEAQASLEGVLPALALSFRTTVAALAEGAGRHQEAAELLDSVAQAAPRALAAHFAVPRVRWLLRHGERDAAGRVARQLDALSRADDDVARRPARIASAMVRAADGDATALPGLLEDAADPHLTVEHALAAACAALALGATTDRLSDRARRILARVPDATLEAYAVGDRAARVVGAAVRGERAPLVLDVAGGGAPRARFHGEAVELSGRLWEVALMLALHPRGLDDERLHDLLVGDGGGFGLSALRTHVSRLRARLPVSVKPYRFEVAVELDVDQARTLLRAGRLREALARVPGPVLAESDAPGVAAVREELAEELRQAALAAGDAEALIELAERMPGDLELWEAALSALPDGDPRRALAQARATRLARDYGVQRAAPLRAS